MRITVLCGGPSAEREVSLISGNAVAQGLRDAGHDVFVSDVSPTDLSALDHPCDVVFPVLHGAFGEDGQIQTILESRGMNFVGSCAAASRIGIDKIATKRVWRDASLPTPGWSVRTTHSTGPVTRQPPCVVKAIDSGSSIDVFLCQTTQERDGAIESLLTKHTRCMIEQLIHGPEITIGLLEGRALPPIRIKTDRAFFDYNAKYTKGGAEHSFDLDLPDDLVQTCMSLAERASDALGCRDLARVDMLIDQETQQPYLLEINTMPGFTPVSLLPEAAAKVGIAFPQLVDRLVKMARSRTKLVPHVRQKPAATVALAS